MDICTIIAKNYVAQARVLARSFAEHHPDGHCSVLVIDDYGGYLDPDVEPFRILTPEQIGCEAFQEMALRYDVLELSTAVKPWLLAYLLNEGAPTITYLDPDIRIYSSLAELDVLARSHGVVLTPHNTEPLPDDGMRPNQIDILLAGVYNLGYVSLRGGEENQTLLSWWRNRLLTDCRVDPLNGYFVDQRWFDLAPALASDHVILREPQYNLAYWNVFSRRLRHAETGYEVDGMPLAFFHFSGFDPETPDLLSRHQSRVSVNANPALRRICDEYADEVIAANYRETKNWPYTYHKLPSGADFNRRLRKLYEVAAERGAVTESPFTTTGCMAFMDWLAEPAPGAPVGVNRLLADLYGTRADLQDAFPDVGGDDHGRFLDWAGDSGMLEEPALRVLSANGFEGSAQSSSMVSSDEDLSVVPAQAPGEVLSEKKEDEPARSWGVNVVGYFRSELGTGEAARQVVSALDARGVPLMPVHGRTVPPNRQGHAFTYLDYTEARYPVNLICMNADVLGGFAAQAGPEFFNGRYSIGMWFWEVEQFPEIWGSAFEHIDELWLPTEHIISAVGPTSSVPITKITLPVELPPARPASRAEMNLPDGFMFLFSFDHHSVFERKNPLAIIEAYTRNFEPNDGAVLVIKSINGDGAPDDHMRLVAAANGRTDIHIVDGYLSPEMKNMTLAACDCYVSLHRAEGFGLTMAEAMYLGKPVVATGYSGNLDFMNQRNSYLVDYRLVPIGTSAPPYPPDARWAEPDVDQASLLMREIFEGQEAAVERGRLGAEDIRLSHSATLAGEIMGRNLDFLRERHGARLLRPQDGISRALEQRVETGPLVGAISRRGRAGKLARRVLLRVLKPFSIYQKSIDIQIVRSIHELESGISNLDATVMERYASLLALIRNEDSSRRVWETVLGLTHSVTALESATGELQAAVGELPEVPRRLEEIAHSLEGLRSENRAIPFMEGVPFAEAEHPQVGVVQGYSLDLDTENVNTYRSFEDIFRGSEEFIRDRQRVYLKLVNKHSPVLDFGCGRGEFLDLLVERGIRCVGVDSDTGMVERCREKGHTEVVEDDGLHYLSMLEDGALGSIFCAQVIEHLPYRDLLRFLRLARLKLGDDGVLIAETVNPHSMPALKTFWVDPTHQHPLFPEVVLALCRASGFHSAFVFHPNGTGDVEHDRFTQGEYAVVAGDKTLLPPRGPGR